MQLRWVIKTTPKVKRVLQGIVDELLGSGDINVRIAGRIMVEVFDLKTIVKGA